MKLYKKQNWLYDTYWNKKCSLLNIAKICDISIPTVCYWMDKFNIQRRTRSELMMGNKNRLGIPHPEEARRKMNQVRKGKNSLNWKGGTQNYYYCRAREIWEDYWLEKPKNGYIIHHLDGNIKNNQINNLALVSHGYIRRGEKSGNWKGGITPKNLVIRDSHKFKEWRKAVLKRDGYTCQRCLNRNGYGKTIHFHVHHIFPFADFPEERFKLDNGATLCAPCHTYIHKAELR